MKLLKASNLLWVAILFILIIFSFTWGYISWDAPYYLSISRDIANGLIPYKDIYNSYTPVVMYLNAGIYTVLNDPGYFFYLGFQYLIMFAGAGLFYKICRVYNASNAIASFLSLMMLLSILSSDGTYIILEVYMIFFVFMAYLAYLKDNFFWCGIFLAMSFFCKQYGIFNFVPFFFLILISKGSKFKNLLNFCLGGLAPLIIFIFYFLLIQEMAFLELLNQLTGNGYAQNKIATEKSLFSLLVGAKVFILLVIPFFTLKWGMFRNKVNLILILGILVNLLPVIIKNFPHYFILTFPYLFILYSRNHKFFDKTSILVSNGILIIISGFLFLRLVRYSDVYEEQFNIAEESLEQYPLGSAVYLCDGYRFLYILNDYRNPVLNTVGYRDWYVPDERFYNTNDVLLNEYCVDPERLD